AQQQPAAAQPTAAVVPGAAPYTANGIGPASDTLGLAAARDTAKKVKFNAGEDPRFAAEHGFPIKGPAALPGALLPQNRIVAYYGNPLSTRMGILGELPPQQMLARFDRELAEWRAADPSRPVIPAMHLIAVVAQGEPGPSGKYRSRMRDTLVEQVARWADSRHGLVFLDVQVGTGSIQEEMPRLLPFLQRPNFHFAVDPEFMMKGGQRPGTKIGTMDASDINWVSAQLAQLVREHHLPPKVLVIHRFTRNMVTNAERIQLRPEVQIVMDMDGWGAPWLKRDSYRDYVVAHPVQFTGFKLFYHNDQKKQGSRMMTKQEVLALRPQPLYIQYQ
ncbi:MAG: hypothetical protein JWM27_3887, partial [Gemmatimonadetes bacterium]|nr:hypothetical protein [Gemmatimonadota bacterium]